MNTGLRRVIQFSYGLAVVLLLVVAFFAWRGAALDDGIATASPPDASVFVGRSADFLLDTGEIGIIDADDELALMLPARLR